MSSNDMVEKDMVSDKGQTLPSAIFAVINAVQST
jgi:hypothetical protein